MLYRSTYFLAAGSMFLSLCCNLVFWKWFYLDGRGHNPLLLFVSAFVGGAVFMFVLNWRQLHDLHSDERPKFARISRPVKWMILIALDVLIGGLFLYPLPPGEIGSLEFIHGFRDSVRSSGDGDAIVEWGRKVSGDPKFEAFDYRPRFIRDYGEPEWIDRNTDKSVEIIWGGGFMHWGLFISSQGAEPPQTNEHTYFEKIDDGLYAAVSRQ